MTILTTAEAAVRLGISPRRVRALIKAEKLPAQKFGTTYMINEKDLRKVENRQTGRPRKQPALASKKN